MNLALQPVAQPGLPAPVEFALGDFVQPLVNRCSAPSASRIRPIYNGEANPARDRVMSGLLRQPFSGFQREVVQAVAALLCDADDSSAIINAEMGTGKTIMAIAAAAVLLRGEQNLRADAGDFTAAPGL